MVIILYIQVDSQSIVACRHFSGMETLVLHYCPFITYSLQLSMAQANIKHDHPQSHTPHPVSKLDPQSM